MGVNNNEDYAKALKLGQKWYKEKTAKGENPYLPVLDDLLQDGKELTQKQMGTMEIPLELVVGTRTAGRTMAFAGNFMPLLAAKTEFGIKWSNLCVAQEEEGIRDAILCYEYMGKFYVEEGNKRVSVLKYFDAGGILARVIRVMPSDMSTPEAQLYAEFLKFYPYIGMYEIQFTKSGSYAKLQGLMGKKADEVWNDDERASIRSLYNWVKKAYCAKGGDKMRTTVSDVLLLMMQMYPVKELEDCSPAELEKRMTALWDNILAMEKPKAIKVSEKPAEPRETLLNKVLPVLNVVSPKLKMAFVYEDSPEDSSWTKQHEFGRCEVEENLGGKVTTVAYPNAGSGLAADKMIEVAILEGADVVFTTSARMVGASLREAAKHPEVRILNCSLDLPYPTIRTYMVRRYETKFIAGVIAAIMSEGDELGFLADSPTYGTLAAINSFAQGAKMVRPNAKVVLRWFSLPGDATAELRERGITIISGRDAPENGRAQQFGIFRMNADGSLNDLGAPFCHWGEFYSHVARSLLNGGWEQDTSAAKGRAVNYWWGLSSGVLDLLLSRSLPEGVQYLAKTLQKGIAAGDVDPFAGVVRAQDGTIKKQVDRRFTPEELIKMDWLCDNVEGYIPRYNELREESKSLYRMQGIHKESIPTEQEAVL